MKRRILLTQPDPSRLYAGLTSAGFCCDHLPLLNTCPTPVNPELLEQHLLDVDFVVVASPAAAHWLVANLPERPNWLPEKQGWFSPGEGTALLLQEWGQAVSFPKGAHNASAMSALVESYVDGIVSAPKKAKKMLWIGSKSNVTKDVSWGKMNIRLIRLVSHITKVVNYDCDRLQAYAQHLWLISSKLALKQAEWLWKTAGMAPSLLVTSPGLGSVASSMGYTCTVASSVGLNQLLAALAR